MIIKKSSIRYLENAAIHSGDDDFLWKRYLNKVIHRNYTSISEDMYSQLMSSAILTHRQKYILTEALDVTSSIHEEVCALSEKAKIRDFRKLILEGNVVDTGKTEKAFELLNERLSKKGITLEITCAGGYILQNLGFRTTMDVDDFFMMTPTVKSLIYEVGEELGLNNHEENELWLNNSISNMNKEPTSDHCHLIKDLSNLKVYAVSLIYLIGMKLESGRNKDIVDVTLLIIHLGLNNPLELYNQLKAMDFTPDFSDILTCFGNVLGSKWLSDYIRKNSSKF